MTSTTITAAGLFDTQKPFSISFHTSLFGEVSHATRQCIEEKVQKSLTILNCGQPFVECSLSNDRQLNVHCIAEATQDTLRASYDLISPWLPQEISVSTFTIQRTLFSIDICPGHTFFFIDIAATLDNEESLRSAEENLSSFQRQITRFLQLAPSCQQMVMALPTSPRAASLLIRQECVLWLSRHASLSSLQFLTELQRVLLATDTEFKALRMPAHLTRCARSHLWLSSHRPSHGSPSSHARQLFYRIFCSKLQFPFGTKDVISLVISLHSLSPYEQFDDRHIMLACKRCLPSLEPIPRSFYMYTYADEPSLSLYMEVEKKDGTPLTIPEMKTLKRELGRELSSSIEQVMSRIDIPHNEEDLLRNFLLLSQQIRTPKSLPQDVIQFHGQSDASLNFYVTLVRPVKEKETTIPLPPLEASPITRCVLVRSSIVGTLRHRFVKQGLVFLVECSKERFLRRDRSVDFLKAREAVVTCIESAYGTVRDLNGGLIYQQHQLLASITPLLSPEEQRELPLVEDLFHSLSPTLMKNILGPEHIVTLFRQLLTLRADLRKKKNNPFLIEEYSKEVFIGFACPDAFPKESVFHAIPHFRLKENDLALCQVTADGRIFCFVICLCQDSAVRQQLPKWFREKIFEKKNVRTSRTFRMSLPRPTLLLDPRIGADRTSGAVIKMLYEGLVRLDPSERPSLAIAEEILVSDDGKTYTFKLRPSLWSNGQPVTAHDFEYAWKKILDPSFNTPYDFLFYPLLNARLVKAGTLVADNLGVHATSDHMLVVELERPMPHFLEVCALWIYSPLCKDIDKTHPGWAYYGDRNYVCNGPFKLDHMSRKGNIHLVKNDRYWDKECVFLEKVDISIVEDSQHALQMFEQKELDWIGDPLSEVSLTGVKDKGSRLESRSISSVYSYMLNVHRPQFRSKKIRHAFSYAISRADIIAQFLYGNERPASSVLSSSVSLFEDIPPHLLNLDHARSLWNEGLLEEGLSKAHLNPLTMVLYNKEPTTSMSVYIAHMWEEAFGLTINIETYGWNEFVDRLASDSYDIFGTFWYSWYRDPAYLLKVISNPSNPFNATKWTHEGVRDLIDRAEMETQKPLRNSLLQQAERLVIEELPAIPIYECQCRYMKSDDVENIHVNYLGNVELTWTTFKKGKFLEASAKASTSAESHEVQLYLQSEPLSLDPRMGGDRRSQIIIHALFEGLTRIGKDGHIELALAQSFSVSDDGRVYTFHLHHSQWSNGTEVTADDFVWAWKSALDPSFPSNHSYAFFPIKNAKKARMKECSLDDIGVTALSPHTLQVELELPAPYFLELLSNPMFSPVCREIAVSSSEWANKTHPHFVSNGPFLIEERIHKSRITLVRNPRYWNPEQAKSERLSFAIVGNPQTAYDLFINGKLDWYGEPFGGMALERVPDLERQGLLVKKKTGTLFWLNCRTDAPHLSSPKIRKALSAAINRTEICDCLLKDCGEPSYSLLSPAMSLLEKPSPTKTAQQLFAEGLFEVGISIESYPPLVISHWDNPTITAAVEKIQQQLQRALGIRVELALLDWKDYMRKLGSGEYQVQSLAWYSWYDDPLYNLEYLKYKDNGLNGTGWERAEYISLLNHANSAVTPSVRQNYLRQAEAFVMDEIPVIPIFYQTSTYAMSRQLGGEVFPSTGTLELKWLARCRDGNNLS